MKKLILIIMLILSISACKKDESVKPDVVTDGYYGNNVHYKGTLVRDNSNYISYPMDITNSVFNRVGLTLDYLDYKSFDSESIGTIIYLVPIKVTYQPSVDTYAFEYDNSNDIQIQFISNYIGTFNLFYGGYNISGTININTNVLEYTEDNGAGGINHYVIEYIK